jgi:hypothetical protein
MFTRLFASEPAAQSAPPKSESGFEQVKSSVGRLFGMGGDDKKPTPAPPARSAAAPAPKPAPAARPAPAASPAATVATAADRTPAKPQVAEQASEPSVRTSSANAGLMTGAAPVVPSGSFDNRWSGLR